MLPSFLKPYAKTVTALVTGYIGWATMVVTSAPSAITGAEWIGFATVAAIGFGVFGTTNKPA